MKSIIGRLSPYITSATERKLVLLLCCFAAVHVFLYSAAYPLFNIVDEPMHYDLVVRYSHGDLPRGLEPMTDEFLQYDVIYGTPEYFNSPGMFPDGKFPPPLWSVPLEAVRAAIEERLSLWKTTNHEASQPPLYYAIAGLWWRMCSAFGFEGGNLLYCIRFLNMLFVVALVWLGYVVARLVFPENIFIKLGVPTVLAFLPQTAFYSVQNDVLQPLCFGVAFYCLVRWDQAEVPSPRLGAATGFALAATWLAKVSSLPLLGVSAVWLLFGVRKHALRMGGGGRVVLPAYVTLMLGVSLPTLAWMTWCRLHFGDFTGSLAKIQSLGWTYKPVNEWGSHPMFTPSGFWTFVSGVISTFWQGEFLWCGKPLSSKSVSLIYTLLSLSFVLIALACLRYQPARASGPQQHALWFGFWCLAGSVLFLGFLSIIFDFHDCFYPSREHPYFTSGRLALGALIPFLLLWFYGLDMVLDWLRKVWLRWPVLAVFILFMLLSELVTCRAVFSSPYNWFHVRHEPHHAFRQ